MSIRRSKSLFLKRCAATLQRALKNLVKASERKILTWRNFLSKKTLKFKAHSMEKWKLYSALTKKIFRQINSLIISSVKTLLTFTKVLKKYVWELHDFPYFSHYDAHAELIVEITSMKFTLILFWQKFRESKKLRKSWFDEFFGKGKFLVLYSVTCQLTEICSFSHFLFEKIRESNVMHHYYRQKSWFYEIFYGEREFLVFHYFS